jgi:hypothetical protein
MFRRVQQEDETREGMFEIKEMKVRGRVEDSNEGKEPVSVALVKYPYSCPAFVTSYFHQMESMIGFYWMLIDTGIETRVYGPYYTCWY